MRTMTTSSAAGTKIIQNYRWFWVHFRTISSSRPINEDQQFIGPTWLLSLSVFTEICCNMYFFLYRGMQKSCGTLAEWLRRGPAKAVCYACVSSNLTGVDCFHFFSHRHENYTVSLSACEIFDTRLMTWCSPLSTVLFQILIYCTG